jgi:hypothetical protein
MLFTPKAANIVRSSSLSEFWVPTYIFTGLPAPLGLAGAPWAAIAEEAATAADWNMSRRRIVDFSSRMLFHGCQGIVKH